MKNISRADCYAYQETIADGQIGETVLVNPVRDRVTCVIVSSGNTGKVQVTTSPFAQIELGNETWVDWAKGDVTATTQDVLVGPVTAIRGVSVSGEITFEAVV